MTDPNGEYSLEKITRAEADRIIAQGIKQGKTGITVGAAIGATGAFIYYFTKSTVGIPILVGGMMSILGVYFTLMSALKTYQYKKSYERNPREFMVKNYDKWIE